MRLPAALAVLAASIAAPAAAHIQLVSPQARSGTATSYDYTYQKAAPCGWAGRTANVTTLQAGATITVLFDEIIDHPGEFRIAFDADGDDDLAPPVWDGDVWSTVGTWVTPPGVTLLAEHVPDLVGTMHGEVQITLPDVACTNCTLQLIQVMTDKPPYVGDNDFYFMCADLVLEVPARCGNGVVEAGEGCDDGNASNDDACLSTCVPASCGDGYIWAAGGETCDDGNLSNDDACLATCVPASCGDGYLWAGVEGCDDGNLSSGDACLATCVPASCGDGYLWVGVEGCDDGNLSNGDACLATCVSATCGDGIVQGGVEACDDGNLSNDDACLATCIAAFCGDGFVRAGVEACDDGNASSTDACLATCVVASCGDGLVRAGVEACDDGNASSGDGCSAGCALEPPASGGGSGGCGAPGAGALALLALVPLAARRRRPHA